MSSRVALQCISQTKSGGEIENQHRITSFGVRDTHTSVLLLIRHWPQARHLASVSFSTMEIVALTCRFISEVTMEITY